jgi:glucose-1-phosphate adenylyltransferase
MDLIELPPKFNLYDGNWPIRTYQEQNPPTKVVSNKKGGRGALISNCLICNGCHLTKVKIERSILSPKVRVDSFAEVNESVIIKGTKIGKYSKIRKAIIDEEVIIPDGYKIGYNLKDDTAKFTVSPLGVVVVVPEEMHVDVS